MYGEHERKQRDSSFPAAAGIIINNLFTICKLLLEESLKADHMLTTQNDPKAKITEGYKNEYSCHTRYIWVTEVFVLIFFLNKDALPNWNIASFST